MILNNETTVNVNLFSNRIVFNKDFAYYNSNKEFKREVLEKNRRDAYNGKMSDATKRHVKKILGTWHEAITVYNETTLAGSKRDKRKLIFITLTLSDVQKHDDKFIKRHMLDRYIIILKRNYDVGYYFWKAEKQKNGRIHFHLMVDRFISMSDIKSEWNKIQRENGYTLNYEKKYNKTEPPSTHVEVIESGIKAIRYVLKYIQKAEDEANENNLKVQGRIWGCSTELKLLKPYNMGEDTRLIETLDKIVDNDSVRLVENDFFIIYYLDVKLFLRQFYPELMRDYNKHYRKLFEDLYIRKIYTKLIDNINIVPRANSTGKPTQTEIDWGLNYKSWNH